MGRHIRKEITTLIEGMGSMSLSQIRHKLSDVKPPYPRKLLDALKQDNRAGALNLFKELRSKQLAESRTKRRIRRMLKYELEARAEGFETIAGVDEVGRGPLAGPVVAAAVILSPATENLPEINDSKLLADDQRRRAMSLITATADVGVGVVSVEEIDRINIHRANLLAIKLAIEDLEGMPDLVLIDGRHQAVLNVPQRTIIKGDKLSMSIAAASIVAKVVRDQMMVEFDKKYPEYKFSQHKGYATSEHLNLIQKNGISPIHRRSFAPVRELLNPQLL